MADLALPFEIFRKSAAGKYRILETTLRGLNLSHAAHDFYRGAEEGEAWASDRRGSLPIPKTFVREAPCYIQSSELSIEWDGTLLPCCQIQNEAFDHDDYGKLDANSDMFVEWTNAKFVSWRLTNFSYKRKKAPCAACKYGMADETPERRADVDRIRAALLDIGAQRAAVS